LRGLRLTGAAECETGEIGRPPVGTAHLR